jgi:hypothetical protein
MEGYPNPGDGDRVLVLDNGGCWLTEIYNAHAMKDGNWSGNSTAVWI